MPNGPKLQILVVDDEPSIRESLGMLLLAAGYDVAEAENGAAAVSQLSRTVPDLIVTDINMPQMSGMELIAHVRSRYPPIPIVAMSGEYQGDAVPASILADKFYLKGQHPHNLLTTIASLIAANPAGLGTHLDRPRLELISHQAIAYR
jgi:adenylate cyclase